MKFKENPVLDGVCAVKLYDLVKLEGQTPKGFSVKLRIAVFLISYHTLPLQLPVFQEHETKYFYFQGKEFQHILLQL